jgi:carbonic anhydrase/acetyltransferase-like protein (isoleucine patch superfamily)
MSVRALPIPPQRLKSEAAFCDAMTIYLAESAKIIGDVRIGGGSSVWHGAVLRGDLDKIAIGGYTNIQDNAVIHLDLDFPAIVGDRVTVGHLAIVHGCSVGSDCVIGMGAAIGNDAVIGDWSVVAPGAVVTESSKFPKESVIVGIPAKVVRQVDGRLRDRIEVSWKIYHELAKSSLTAKKDMAGDESKRIKVEVAGEIASIIRNR